LFLRRKFQRLTSRQADRFMTDNFALLNEPRRPWLESEPLKQKFLSLSSAVHPDRAHHLGEAERNQAQNHYTELNAAYQCLREPKDRLRHLLELERGFPPPKEIQQIPPELMDVFMEIGQLCRQADAFIADKEKVSSPLLKVQSFERGQGWTDKLREMQAGIAKRRTALMEELRELDAAWIERESEHAGLYGLMENVYRLLGYFDRWLGQMQERITRLSF
jgi:DnaJ-domain-containing protein 1